MANRFFEQFYLSLVKGKVVLFGKAAIGAVGAPTLSAANSKGIASIVRKGLGDYEITLQDTYNSLLGFQPVVLLASGTPAVASVAIKSETVATTKIVRIQCLDFAGAAVDPDSGAVLYFEIKLKNSSV